MSYLTQFFHLQELAAERPEWPRLRAVLTVREGVAWIHDKTEYALAVYANGRKTWCKTCEEPGRAHPKPITERLMGQILREAALCGFCQSAAAHANVANCHPNESAALLPDEVQPGEILPKHD